MTAASPALVNAFKASLANADHDWTVTSATKLPVTQPLITDPLPEPETIPVNETVAVYSEPLGVVVTMFAVLAPAFSTMMLMMGSATLSSDDEDLYDTLTSMAEGFTSEVDAAMATLFTEGPDA